MCLFGFVRARNERSVTAYIYVAFNMQKLAAIIPPCNSNLKPDRISITLEWQGFFAFSLSDDESDSSYPCKSPLSPQ